MVRIHKFDFALDRACTFDHTVLHDSEIVDQSTHDYHFQDAVLTDAAVRGFSATEKDLRDVVMAIHLADRCAARKIHKKRDNDGLYWSRKIYVRVGVRNPERWSANVLGPLRTLLRRLSGDDWQFEIVERRLQRDQQLALGLPWEKRGRRSSRPQEWRVALCSEGLDSWAGLCDQLRLNPTVNFLLVSYTANPRVSQILSRLLASMPVEDRARIRPVSFSVREYERTQSEKDPSLRTRGLLFLTGGALAVQLMGLRELSVWENGIGAFNFDFDASQLPGQATRAVHPLVLALFGSFISQLLRVDFHVTNPYLFKTKAEMCRALDTPDWRHIIGQSFTCGHEHRIKGRWHCGACTSCLMRRWSLRAANLWREDTTRYVYDLSQPDSVDAIHRVEWHKTQNQLRRMKKCLAAGDEESIWRAIQAMWPDVRDSLAAVCDEKKLSPTEFRRGLLALLRAHCSDGLELGATKLQLLPTKMTQDTQSMSLFDFDSVESAA